MPAAPLVWPCLARQPPLLCGHARPLVLQCKLLINCFYACRADTPPHLETNRSALRNQSEEVQADIRNCKPRDFMTSSAVSLNSSFSTQRQDKGAGLMACELCISRCAPASGVIVRSDLRCAWAALHLAMMFWVVSCCEGGAARQVLAANTLLVKWKNTLVLQLVDQFEWADELKCIEFYFSKYSSLCSCEDSKATFHHLGRLTIQSVCAERAEDWLSWWALVLLGPRTWIWSL